MNVAINGFGRIGRAVLKICLENKINVVAINDVHGPENAAYLLKFDSIYGRFKENISYDKDSLKIKGKKIKVLSEREISKLPWKQLKVDIIIESTGVFTNPKDASQHLKSGAKYVLITAPCKGEKPSLTIVPGVNHHLLKKDMKIISVASCTTNCLVPVVHVLHKNFGISRALMTTAHAYTNDQELHDSPHKKVRRGRAAALNIVPTSTGAAEAIDEVLPELTGKVNGLALRVPVPVGSLTDLVAEVSKRPTVEQVNQAFESASMKELKGILEYSKDELVSSDVIGNPHSAVLDSLSTQVDGNLVKVLAWYDNEFGYSNRVVDVIKMLSKWC